MKIYSGNLQFIGIWQTSKNMWHVWRSGTSGDWMWKMKIDVKRKHCLVPTSSDTKCKSLWKRKRGCKAGSAEGRRPKCKSTCSRWKWFIICTGKIGKTKTSGRLLANCKASTKYNSERFVLIFKRPCPFGAWMMLKRQWRTPCISLIWSLCECNCHWSLGTSWHIVICTSAGRQVSNHAWCTTAYR